MKAHGPQKVEPIPQNIGSIFVSHSHPNVKNRDFQLECVAFGRSQLQKLRTHIKFPGKATRTWSGCIPAMALVHFKRTNIIFPPYCKEN